MAERSRCGDWSKASRASLRKGVTAHGPGAGPPGRGAKERRTPGLIFRDALEQPGGKPGWLGTARARNGRTPGRDSKPGASRKTSAKASEAENQQHALLFVRREKKQVRARGLAPAEPDHRSGKNVRSSSSPPSARMDVIDLAGARCGQCADSDRRRRGGGYWHPGQASLRMSRNFAGHAAPAPASSQ
jgi:hypothetical protein